MNLRATSDKIYVCSKLNLITITTSSNEVMLYDLQGNNPRSINTNDNANHSGIAIIAPINEIAISDYNNNNIGFYDLTNLKKKYNIGDGILNKPMGISFCPQNGLLAVYNSGSTEVLLFLLDDNSSWKFHSKLPFIFPNINPVICISPNHLIVGVDNLYLFNISEMNNDFTVQFSISLNRTEQGWKDVTIHPTGNYWIVCSNFSLYFMTFNGNIICTFTPRGPNQIAMDIPQIKAIAVDGDDDFISLLNSSANISLIRSPLINGNSFEGDSDIDKNKN